VKDKKKSRSHKQAVKYQIVQRYFGEDEVLNAMHRDKELTYPRKFDSPDDAQELIDITLQNNKFEGWDLEVIEHSDVDQLLEQNDDTSTFNYLSSDSGENEMSSTDAPRSSKQDLYD